MTDTDKRPLLYDPMPRKDIELPPRMPEADTIARLTAELAEARRERDAALAGAVEQAAKSCDKIAGNTADFGRDYRRAAGHCAAEIRALAPADALAAQTRRDAQVRAKGMRAAAKFAVDDNSPDGLLPGALADGMDAAVASILALAAQTEEAANG